MRLGGDGRRRCVADGCAACGIVVVRECTLVTVMNGVVAFSTLGILVQHAAEEHSDDRDRRDQEAHERRPEPGAARERQHLGDRLAGELRRRDQTLAALEAVLLPGGSVGAAERAHPRRERGRPAAFWDRG